MPTVPPELLPWVSLAKDCATLVAACIGAWVAIKGLNAWRRQLRGKTDYELARKILRASYKVREAIRAVRHPAIWNPEFAAAEKQVVVENDDLKRFPDAARLFAVYQVRWSELSAAVTELDAEAFEAEISWGAPFRAKLLELRKLVSLLRWAVDRHIEKMADSSGRMQPPNQEVDDLIYDKSGKRGPDDFAQKIQSAVSEIEEALRPHLR